MPITAERSEAVRLRLKALVAMPPGSPIPPDIEPEVAPFIEQLREKHARDMADCEDISASKPSKQVNPAPQHPESLRQRVIDELMWSIDQAKMHNDHASVASYAAMLLPFVRMG